MLELLCPILWAYFYTNSKFDTLFESNDSIFMGRFLLVGKLVEAKETQ